jgi:hypothetical protein
MDGHTILTEPRRWAQDISIATLAGLVLGVTGPFGTYVAAPVETRLAYWVGLLWCSLLFYAPAVRVVTLLSMRLVVPRLVAHATAVLLATVPMSALTSYAAAQVWGSAANNSAFGWYLQVLLVSLPVATIQLLIQTRQLTAIAVPSGPAKRAPHPMPAAKPRLFARSSKLDGQLYCLQMQDHYVRVYSSNGTALLLLRLRDAMEEVAGVEGLQVHRSWWVARAAVVRVRREGQRLMLRLANGIDVPVSRGSATRLRKAGWLQRSGETL